MKLFLISLKSKEHSKIPQCALDALTCAKKFSGCDVIALTDMPTDGWMDAAPYMESSNAFKQELLKVLKAPLQRYFPMSARYFVMEEYIAKHGVSEPVFNCDWDILVFSDLPEHFKSVGGLDTDLCSCLMRHSGKLQAPMLISNLESIKFYTDMMRGYLKAGYSDNIFFCDITQWIEARKNGPFTDSASCSTLDRDTYFDFNIGMEGDVFHMKDGGKFIIWKNGVPYFKRKDDGLVRAVSIHCFCGWRTKTSELLAKAMSGYSDA